MDPRDPTDLLLGRIEITAGASVSRETLERLRLMRPSEMRDAIGRMFPGSPLAHMRARVVEGVINVACMRGGLVRMRALGQQCPWPAAAGAPAGQGTGAARLSRRVLGGSAAPASGPAPPGAPRRTRVAARRRAQRRKTRSAARGKVLGLPWLQAVGILAGIVTGAIVAVAALAQLFR